ncbi:A-kinase anchor protein 11-like [Poecilia latipinna]|uniref:A-kinase anchor protein 11 n=1 Tax=Poecilia latipinna TaxID=48699 RepID=UPI00072E69F9|nr:PREDICTED: A-kinase anchor protein 11-like [Poecilia latipinna]XP_014915963.1 PREDICTED: A-kinase anchor protein 11-like [Poecilia latipinna]
MQTLSTDSKWREPVPETSGKGIPMYADILDEFAQNLADNIILSSLEQMEKLEPAELQPIQTPETFAEELASAIVEVALKDVCLPQYPPSDVEKNDCEEAENGPPASGEEEDLLEREMISLRELQTHRNSQSNHPPLYQSGLPAVGSLDYPDAPPTTPLIPELERSRNSFARKLKGGLAKVFLPSPPPPTPKDKEDNSGGVISDPQVELMEHLMHSLSTNDLARDGLQAHGAGVEAFAEVLSCDVLSWVLSVKNKQQGSDESDLHQLAHQLAETIITSSLDKAKCDLLSD